MRLYKALGSIFIILASSKAFALDPSVSVYVDHESYTSARIYEFDIMIKATGATSSFALRTFQTGLYLKPSWVNGGTVSIQSVSTWSEMNGQGYNGAFQWNTTDKLVNCSVNFDVLGPVTCISSTVTTTPLLITRVRLTNSVDFTCLSPDIKFNYVSNISPLRLRSTFSWREIGCTTNYEMFYPGRTYTGTALFHGETYSISDADGKSPASVSNNNGFCLSELTVKAIIEGYYEGNGQMRAVLLGAGILHAQGNQADSITVELRTAGNPAVLATPPIKTILNTSGTAYCLLPNSLIGTSCWVVLKNRSAVETWSKNPVTLTSRTSFDFTQ